jgi:hypothetical protein
MIKSFGAALEPVARSRLIPVACCLARVGVLRSLRNMRFRGNLVARGPAVARAAPGMAAGEIPPELLGLLPLAIDPGVDAFGAEPP